VGIHSSQGKQQISNREDIFSTHNEFPGGLLEKYVESMLYHSPTCPRLTPTWMQGVEIDLTARLPARTDREIAHYTAG